MVLTNGGSANEPPIRVAQNNNAQRTSDAISAGNDDRVKLPPGDYIDELADFVEWIANAKPEDEKIIRAEIKRYYYDVGDIFGGEALHRALSDILEPGLPRSARQDILNSIARYAAADPAEMGQLRALLVGGALSSAAAGAAILLQDEEAAAREITATTSAEVAAADLPSQAWKWGWAKRGQILDQAFRDGSLPPLFRVIDNFTGGIATSIKSIDLNAATYQDAARLISRLNKYIDQLGEYEGGALQNIRVKSTDIAGRTLKLVVPRGSMTTMQRQVIEEARIRAAVASKYPVTIDVTPF